METKRQGEIKRDIEIYRGGQRDRVGTERQRAIRREGEKSVQVFLDYTNSIIIMNTDGTLFLQILALCLVVGK